MVAAVATLASTLAAFSFATPASAISAGIPFAAENSSTWQANGVAYAVASVGGVVAVGGSFTQISPPTGGTGSTQSRVALALFDADSGNPTTCQFTIATSSGTASIRAIAKAQTGNTLYIGGNFTSVNGVARSRIAAIDPVACTLSTTFTVTSVNSTVWSLYPAPNGTLYFGGQFATVSGSTRNRAAAVNATTGALTAFNPNLTSTDVLDPNNTRVTTLPTTVAKGFALSPDGTKLAMGGEFDLVNGADSHALAIVDPTTGALTKAYPMYDRTTNPSGVFDNFDSLAPMVSDSTGFYVGGNGAGPGNFDGRAAFDWSTLDYRWKDTCQGATQSLALLNNVLYAANHAHDCSTIGAWQGDERQHFTAQPTDAASFNKFYGWFPDTNDGIGEAIGPRGIAIVTGASGKQWFWAVGEFTKVNNVNQQSITRFGTTDSNAPTAPTVTAQALLPGQIQVRFRSAYDTDDSLLTYKLYRNGSTTPMWTGTATSYFWTRPQVTVVDSSVTAGTSYSYRVTVTDASGNTSALSTSVSATAAATGSSYAAAVTADQPSFYWRYDETSGTWLQDKSGATTTGINGLYGTPGGVTYNQTGAIPGDTSKAVTFDGSTGYVWEDQFVYNPSTYTEESWFKTTTTSGGLIMGFGSQRETTDTKTMTQAFGGGTGSSTFDGQVFMSDDGKVNYGVISGSAQTLSSSATYNDGNWHQVVASIGSGGTQLYVDGSLVNNNAAVTAGSQSFRGVWHVGFDATQTQTTTFGPNGPQSTSTPVWAVSPTSSFFAGSIDETAVYPTQLSAAKVASHYTAGGGTITGGADTTAPTAPTGVATSVSGSTVNVSWTAATDNVGVTGYRVYRGASSDFTPGTSTLLGTATTTSYSDLSVAPGSYYYKVIAVDAAGNASDPSTGASATVVDSTPPTSPSGVTATTSGTTVNLGWTASTDDTGVTGYQVYRSTTSGFTPSSSTLIGSPTTTSYADTGLAAGTYYYKVVAVDAAGNASDPSSQASATVASQTSTSVSLTPTEDTYVASTATTTNYGTSTSLTARGTSGELQSYLKFALPTLPAGATLTGATLTVKTTTDSTAGSTDSFPVSLLTGSWSESSTTWATRPTGIGATLGTLSGASATSSTYTVTLSAAQLQSLMGTTTSFAITGSGADNIRLWSKEYTTVASRPTLKLTYLS